MDAEPHSSATLTLGGTTLVVSGVKEDVVRLGLYLTFGTLARDTGCNQVVREAAAILLEKCQNKGLTEAYYGYAKYGCFYLAAQLFQLPLVGYIPVDIAPLNPETHEGTGHADYVSRFLELREYSTIPDEENGVITRLVYVP